MAVFSNPCTMEQTPYLSRILYFKQFITIESMDYGHWTKGDRMCVKETKGRSSGQTPFTFYFYFKHLLEQTLQCNFFFN